MKNLNPSNSNIKVDPSQFVEGAFESCKVDCTAIVKKNLSTDERFLIGHVSFEWFRPRIKGYEKHLGLQVKIIIYLYVTQSKSEAHNMEGYLIDQFKSHPLNKNIRKETSYTGKERNEPYVVYLAKE